MALRGYLAQVMAQSTEVAFTDEATTTSDNQNYTITDTDKTLWDLETEIVVEDGGVATTEDYTVSRLTGTVTFDSVDAGRTITVTGAYVTPTEIAQAKSYSLGGSLDTYDSTYFQKAFREFKSGNATGTVDLSRWWTTDDFFNDMILADDIRILELYPNTGLTPFRCFARISADSISAAVDGLVEESISFTITTEAQ